MCLAAIDTLNEIQSGPTWFIIPPNIPGQATEPTHRANYPNYWHLMHSTRPWRPTVKKQKPESLNLFDN